MWRFGNNPRRLLGASAVSSTGDGLLLTALPLLALANNGKAIAATSVFAAGRFPWIFALVFGSMADRVDARKVMIGADVVRGAMLAILGIYLLLGDRQIPIWALLAISVVMSIGSIFFFAGTQRAIPLLVESKDLEEVNGTLESVRTAGEMFVGPVLGAQFLTAGKFPIIGDAISFLGSAAVLSGLDPMPADPSELNLGQEISAGFNWFIRSRIIRTLAGVSTIAALFSGGVLATEAVLIKTTLRQSNTWFGIFTVVLAVGSIVGGMIAPRVVKALGVNSLVLPMLGTGLAYLGCTGSRSVPVIYSVMFLQQLVLMIGIVASLSVRQRAIPTDIRGRVITLTRSLSFGSQVLGALVGGWLADRHGTDSVFLVAGLVISVTAIASARTFRRMLTAAALT
jgi:MFS family permease